MNIKHSISNFVSNALYVFSAIWLFLEISNQKPEQPVVGICLEGDTSLRLQGTLDLYNKGIINYIIVSGGIDDLNTDNIPASIMKEILVKNGVPAEVIEVDNDSKYTDDHPVYVCQIAKEHGFKNLLVITSGYHLIRAYIRFLYTIASENYDFRLYGYPIGNFSSWFQKSPTEKKYRLSLFLYDELKKVKTYRNLTSLEAALKYVKQLTTSNSENPSKV